MATDDDLDNLGDDEDEDDNLDAAQRFHETAAAYGVKLGFDFCSGKKFPSGASPLLHAHKIYHDLAVERGASCPGDDVDDDA